MAGEQEAHSWQPISSVPNQTTVLVCNDCLLGWYAVAIQSALNEWHYADRGWRQQLEHEPTHWQRLPSIHPIALRKGRVHAN